MNLTIKNILVNLLYYATTVVFLPWVLLTIETAFGVSRHPFGGLRLIAAFLGAAGILLQLWCVTLFQRVGRGTPSPVIPPVRLVTSGPYGRVRNPMNIGEILLFLGLAAWFASGILLLYALVAWVACHAFVVRWEEPTLLRSFGEEYRRYRIRTNRWFPRRRRQRLGDADGG